MRNKSKAAGHVIRVEYADVTVPEGSILDAVGANENTLSYIDDVIKRAEKK